MKKKYVAGTIVIGIAAVICAAIGVHEYFLQSHAGKEYEEIRGETGSGVSQEKEKESEKAAENIPIDFTALQKRNPEVYAWITIPGTAIDYPILQSETDNSYYLTHTIDRAESPEGAIFTENYNTKDFKDPNTVIYGHDMKNGSMFQNLHKYQDRDFFDKNREVIIYMPDEILHYRIFAAYIYDDRHILLSFNFEDPDVYGQYLRQIFSMRDMTSNIDTGMSVGTDDKIITLSTCYGTQADKRYLVQAVLESIEK